MPWVVHGIYIQNMPDPSLPIWPANSWLDRSPGHNCTSIICQYFYNFSIFQIFVSPPLYRHQPLWYNRSLAQVATRFSSAFSATSPANLHLLPSFISQDLLHDGVFLSPVSGLHYMLHVFDTTQTILDSLGSSTEAQLVQVRENVRVHDDRLAYLENKHDGIKKKVSHKAALDSEFNDWILNRSEEDWLTITGLKRILGDLTSRDWQVAVQRQVTEFLRAVLKAHRAHLDFKVVYVQNPVRGRTSGMSVLNAQINSVDASRRLRDLFSGFFRRNKPTSLPDGFRGIQVRNKVTLATRIRISILQELASNYKESNPGSSVNVSGYKPRPQLTTIPARGSSSRPRTYFFVEAVTTLPPVFSDEALARIFQKVGQHHQGELKELFVVLDDDDRARCEALVQARLRSGPRSGPPAGGSSSGPSAPATFSAAFASAGGGMDLEAGFLSSLRAPPPPPPGSPPPTPPRDSGKERGKSSKKSPRRDKAPDRSPSRKHEESKSRRSDRSGKTRRSGKPSKKRSGKSSSSKHGKTSKRGFKRNRHTPPPGERGRKKARHYSSSSSSSGSTGTSGSGSDSGSNSGSRSDSHSSTS